MWWLFWTWATLLRQEIKRNKKETDKLAEKGSIKSLDKKGGRGE